MLANPAARNTDMIASLITRREVLFPRSGGMRGLRVKDLIGFKLPLDFVIGFGFVFFRTDLGKFSIYVKRPVLSIAWFDAINGIYKSLVRNFDLVNSVEEI